MPQFNRVNWPKELRGFKSKSIRLSKQVVEYLKADQIFVNTYWKLYGGEDIGPRFPQLEQLIKEILDEFDGKVFIKLNWRAPLDCGNWVQDMCFDDLHDIFMALKTSGIIMEMISDYDDILNVNIDEDHLITHNAQGYVLEIRKYYKLNPLSEYRCFVKDQHIVAISQRNLFQISDQNPEKIKCSIVSYFDTIKHLIPLTRYVLDLYIDIPPKFNIIVVDINPWQEHTRSKLFSQEELETLTDCEVRLVLDKHQVIQEDYQSYRVCDDFQNFDNLDEIIKLTQQQQ